MRRLVRKILAHYGYSILRRPRGIGGDPFADMANFVGTASPVVFDVGANVGQSIQFFRSWFPDAQIHSFEPSPATFQVLKSRAAADSGVRVWNCGMGSRNAEMEFLENSLPECSSFFPLGENGWGTVERKTVVPVRTVDDFCAEHKIAKIDILKTDTQGYELEVLKGAGRMCQSGAVGLVFCEMIIAEQYAGAASFGKLFDFLVSQGFLLVSFYDISYDKGLAAWTDGLFIHRARLSRRGETSGSGE
jgi:FkbM family methyltransferase